MPTILAIETSTELASAALLRGERLLQRESSGVQTHSQTVLPMVQSLLTEAGIALAECDAIAFGAGPGSFTGVRTACGIVQGLAFGAGLGVVPVITLQAMAQACREACGAADVLAVLDARMGEVYWAQYRYLDNAWQTVTQPTLSAPSTVQAAGSVTACGNGLAAYADAFSGQPFMRDAQPQLMPHAAQVARLARAVLAQGGALTAAEARPFYLRDKIALTTAERAAKAAA
jgi:tRNA threonylcarbamoyladenosine biosynthesis protein TsaB